MTCGGALLKGGEVVLDRVPVTLAEAPGGGQWAGTVVLPPGRFLAAGLYVLRLDDGRAGDVFVSGVATGHDPEPVAFRGSGRLA